MINISKFIHSCLIDKQTGEKHPAEKYKPTDEQKELNLKRINVTFQSFYILISLFFSIF